MSESSIGASIQDDGTRFRIWAPEIKKLELVLLPRDGKEQTFPMQREGNGIQSLHVPGAKAGDRYWYRIDGQGPFPDPASRFQPEGVHGPSEIIDTSAFSWTDDGWKPILMRNLNVYELHVGTFTPEGTFRAVIEKLPYLRDLGITAVELMPVADFPGERNWGYDGVSLFAPARCYGRPEDLRELVNQAHDLGLAMLLDVVYNHFGPDGNYTGVYSPFYTSSKHKTPWGDSLNFDDTHSEHVRRFFIDNALYWLNDFHFDGLRLDATHAIRDDSKEHFLAQLTSEVREKAREPEVLLIAEDHRNLARIALPQSNGGLGLDGIWADDFHHQHRCLLAGDRDGYFRDFQGTLEDLATTIRQGWFYTGQFSQHLEEERGTDPTPLQPPAFVVCLQNHDQTGNRALGERLHHQIEASAYRAASTLFLCCPKTPLLFMGQEWAASSPFLFFTDHNEQLGPLVTQGRREEFKHFKAFADPAVREQIPDPQALSTFERSRLPWSEIEQAPHRGIAELYKRLLKLRRHESALQRPDREHFSVAVADDSTLLLRRWNDDGASLAVVCRYRGEGAVDVSGHLAAEEGHAWKVVLSSEDKEFTSTDTAPRVEDRTIHFVCPTAVILRYEKS